MSPTGRRRFRKMNRRFRQRGPVGVRDRARKTTGGKARKMILVQYWGRDPLPLPAKAFTARSLVGMTQGARKRKARDDKELSEFLVATLAKIEHTEERAKYRIGQKLRPCPGCSTCARPCHYCEMQEPDDSRCPRCRQVMYSTPICDGSGVLPARRA